MKPMNKNTRAVISVIFWVAMWMALILQANKIASLQKQIDRQGRTPLICHQIKDAPSGDRLCVAP